jgi:uncharacterized protein YqgC (DUF456 family)
VEAQDPTVVLCHHGVAAGIAAVTITLYVIGILLILTGLAGLLLPALPGAPVIFAGILAVAWAGDFTRIGVPGLVVAGVLAAFISVVDFASQTLGARRFGASYWGMLGAVAGLIAGLPAGFPGIVLGPLAGAVLLEYLKEPDFQRAGRIGFGTLIGFVLGTALKYALALFLLGTMILLYFL